ncbi:MAG TPA: hypothetical protein VM901_11555 [Bdellovibrionota bacterium]|nr:hypothetical protein [Bdellovibrionota bacterium]
MNLEVLAVFFMPWVMDLAGGRALMGTLFGAILWGTAVILVSARAQIRDPKISRALLLLIWALAGAWISYWLFAFSNEPQHGAWLGRPLQWLALTHAGLLTAGAAFLSVGAVFAVFWLWGERRIRKGSWQRRGFHLRLPSLEASSRIALRSFVMGTFMWTCGLLLAATNGFIQWSAGVGAFAGQGDSRWAWATDSKFVVGITLWALLIAGWLAVQRFDKSHRSRYIAILLLSIVFLLGFYCLLTLDANTRHIPVRWFVE